MGFINPKTGKEEIDLYADPAKKGEYARYMSKLAPNDISEKQRDYWKAEADMYDSSKAGHADMNEKAKLEIARRLAARDAGRR
jgi:hypothetical protein